LPAVPKKRVNKGYLQIDSVLDQCLTGLLTFLPHSSQSPVVQVVFSKNGDLYLSTIGFDRATSRELINAGRN
jgi:hypothetical protein